MAIASVQTCWGVDALHVGVIRVDKNQCKEKEKKRLTWLDASTWTCWHAETDWTWMTVKTREKKKKRKAKLTGFPEHRW